MTGESETRQSARVFRIALIGSLLLHLVLALVAFRAFDTLAKITRLAEKPKEQDIVTISSAIRLEKRAKPIPVSPAVHARVAQRHLPLPQPPAPAQQAQPVAMVEPKPQVAPQPRKPELAKLAPTAPPVVPTEAPHHAPRVPHLQHVALAEHPSAVARAPQEPGQSGRYSDEQLTQIQHDLEKTIAEARTANDPLRAVPKETPAAPKHYHVQMEGRFGDLSTGEGFYFPIRGWKSSGLDYYYVSYEFTWADGTYETGSVPWPIHFDPSRDPFTNPGMGPHTPLPFPPPGFPPPPNLGKALRPFFPGYAFNNRG
ncbi:MAG: hypothetical protein ACLPYS_06340 [Vulcanimicrobiaceae bacterium]